MGPREPRGENDSSHFRQRAQNRRVALLGYLSRFVLRDGELLTRTFEDRQGFRSSNAPETSPCKAGAVHEMPAGFKAPHKQAGDMTAPTTIATREKIPRASLPAPSYEIWNMHHCIPAYDPGLDCWFRLGSRWRWSR
jgi:hypothetical protein